jgi:NADH-quinone oxidoreductase subunit N
VSVADFCAIFPFNKSLALSFLLALFSMAGVPPLVGFYAKFCVFFSVLKSNYFVVVVIAFLLTVVSSFFYVRLIKTAFFEKIINFTLFESLSCVQANILSLTSFFLVFFFFNPLMLDFLAYRLAFTL